MALYLGDNDIYVCECGNTVFAKKEECRLKIIRGKKFPERVKTVFVCTKCQKVAYEKTNDFED